MKFKVTRRNKIDGCIEYNFVEADSEDDARYESEAPDYQVVNVRPLRMIGEKPEKTPKSPYVSIKRLRARVERDLCDKQMKLGKYSPEAQALEQEQLRKELEAELN